MSRRTYTMSRAMRTMSRPKRAASRGAGAGFTLIEMLVALLILGIMAALGYGSYRAARLSADRTEASLKRSREIEFGMRIIVQDLAETAPRPVRDILGVSRLAAVQGTGGVGTLSATTDSGLGANSSMSFNSQSFNSQNFKSDSSTSGTGWELGGGSNSNTAPIVVLTRMGWSNTAGEQRGGLQRVSYGLVDDVLKRSYQINLDTVQGNQPVVQDLFTGVKAIQLRYLDNNQTWQNQWPPPGGLQSTAVTQSPALGQSTNGVPTPIAPQSSTAVQSESISDNLSMRPVAVELIIEFKDWGKIRRLVEVAG
jgi:type II secretion system protein J